VGLVKTAECLSQLTSPNNYVLIQVAHVNSNGVIGPNMIKWKQLRRVLVNTLLHVMCLNSVGISIFVCILRQ